MPTGDGVRLIDGQLSFEGGIDSGRVTTMASAVMPNGLKPNQLAWLTNGTVRGGGVSQRLGWKPVIQGQGWVDQYQGGFLYEPDFANPHLVLSIGGRIYKIRVDTDNSVEDLSASTGLTNPPLEEHGYFAQGEQFLVIQVGDLITKPLFYDGTTMRRSNGFVAVGSPTNEIPPATSMDYYMGRLWYTIGRTYIAGDIVGGPSGTAPYGKRDAILKVTENPVALAGDGFIVPTNAGSIRALKHSANLNTSLGEGQLYIFTRKTVYATSVPVKRLDWSTLEEPLQRVAQINFGSYSDRSVVPVNGDLYYSSPPNGDIRSLLLAIRYFNQPGNVPLSRNENRVLRINDRALLRFASGIEFDNRLLQTVLPFQTPVGAAHKGIMPLDFDLISSLEEKLPPVWEGMLEGLDVLQLFSGDFGGRQRAFAVIYSRETFEIEVWELTTTDRFDKQDDNLNGNRVSWFLETPSYTWGDVFKAKKLDGLELWIDKLLGKVEFRLQYRVDQDPCWRDWAAWTECSAKDCHEDPEAASCPAYPTTPYCEGFRPCMTVGPPPAPACDRANDKPSNLGYQFQVRLIIKGWCRVRGILVYAIPAEIGTYQNLVCSP